MSHETILITILIVAFQNARSFNYCKQILNDRLFPKDRKTNWRILVISPVTAPPSGGSAIVSLPKMESPVRHFQKFLGKPSMLA